MKKSQISFIYIIFIALLNICLIYTFNTYIKSNKQKAVQLLSQALEEKSLQIAAIINLVDAHIAAQDAFTKKGMESYTELLKTNIDNGIFDLANIIITNKDGTVLFTSVPQIDNTHTLSLKHRSYFKAAINSPNKIHVGSAVQGIISKREAIPFAKAIHLKNGKDLILAGAGLDIFKLMESINDKSFANILPALSHSNLEHYSEAIEFPNIFKEGGQFRYKVGLKYNKEFYTAAAIIFLPLNALLILLIIMHMHSNAIRRKIYIQIQKLFPDEFKNSIATDNNKNTFDASMDALNRIGNQINDYKGSIRQVGEAIDKIIRDNKLNSIEMIYLEQEILTMLSDSEIDLNAEYKSSILEMNEEAKGVSQILNIVLSSIGEAIKEITLGKRELTLQEIIAVSETTFHIESPTNIEKSFWLLKDIFLDRIDSVKQFLTNVCDPSSLTMSVKAKDADEIVLQYKGAIDENKNKLETTSIRNCLLHYKLKCLNKLSGVEYAAKDTKKHWLLTITLKS